jgi:asparagine synthase (glutamine-hydrolysing)
MCGINGLISPRLTDEKKLAIVSRMNERLRHRGPDNKGTWNEPTLCLGHTRLSIIDLNEASNQPFVSGDERYIIVYNGELYNYRELKLELQRAGHGSNDVPYFFKTLSDTEVVLAAYIRWGTRCIDYFNGMFAFAVYDRHNGKLLLARDRLGVKPLYYYYGNEGFIFSSELRAILHSGIREFVLNRDVVGEYAMYQTVHAPQTIVKGISMLMPGHYAVYQSDKMSVTRYYNINELSAPEQLTYKETCHKVNELLTLSVQRRLVADVPFGAFLSGGIDSSAIVGLMSKVSTQKVETFNVSFDESKFSEAQYARLIAKKFNTQHHEIVLPVRKFLQELPRALAAMDHPSGDGPNTFVVAKATKEAGITMALSGIGGDELFAGYDIFKRMSELNRRSWLNAVPRFMRKTAGYIISRRNRSIGNDKIAELLGKSHINFLNAYPLGRSLFTQKELALMFDDEAALQTIDNILRGIPQQEDHLLSAVSVAEISTYLQNVLLRDTDQMSMAVALEVREPFLDRHLVDFVLGLPDEYKFPHSPKKLLVDSLGDLLPGEIVYRPKMGFTLPWDQWLRNELRQFVSSHIGEFSRYDFCNGEAVRNLWSRFLSGDKQVTWSRIWHLVVLNHWISENNLKPR